MAFQSDKLPLKNSPNLRAIYIRGKGGIRTLDTIAGMQLFESCAFNHSATFPDLVD